MPKRRERTRSILWIDLDRAPEWIGGQTRVTDVSGPLDQAGTTYTAWFGRMRSPSVILEAEWPRLLKARFGSRLPARTTQVTFEEEGDGTRITQEFWTEDSTIRADPTFARLPRPGKRL